MNAATAECPANGHDLPRELEGCSRFLAVVKSANRRRDFMLVLAMTNLRFAGLSETELVGFYKFAVSLRCRYYGQIAGKTKDSL